MRSTQVETEDSDHLNAPHVDDDDHDHDHDEYDDAQPGDSLTHAPSHAIPSSPPPSFHSGVSSPSSPSSSSSVASSSVSPGTSPHRHHRQSRTPSPTQTQARLLRPPRQRPHQRQRRSQRQQQQAVDPTLADSFGADEDDDEERQHDGDYYGGADDRQRLIRGAGDSHRGEAVVDIGGAGGSNFNTIGVFDGDDHGRADRDGSSGFGGDGRGRVWRFFSRVRDSLRMSSAGPSQPGVVGSGAANDGVFANLAVKPEVEEVVEDLPPVCMQSISLYTLSFFITILTFFLQSYEQAAADATPPYWETTVLAPGMTGDEIYVDGLPVGTMFSFIWNTMISTFFQLAGFFLTYLLHTTHAAKSGSKAGLGLTLVQYGFYLKSSRDSDDNGAGAGPAWGDNGTASPDGKYPSDPNSYNFNPGAVDNAAASSAAAAAAAAGSGSADNAATISPSEAVSYILMIAGWFILIRAFSNYLQARRHEQLVLAGPDRGLPVPIVAEGRDS